MLKIRASLFVRFFLLIAELTKLLVKHRLLIASLLVVALRLGAVLFLETALLRVGTVLQVLDLCFVRTLLFTYLCFMASVLVVTISLMTRLLLLLLAIVTIILSLDLSS